MLPYVAVHGYAGLRAVVSDDDFGHVYDRALVGVVVSFYRGVGDAVGYHVAVGGDAEAEVVGHQEGVSHPFLVESAVRNELAHVLGVVQQGVFPVGLERLVLLLVVGFAFRGFDLVMGGPV